MSRARRRWPPTTTRAAWRRGAEDDGDGDEARATYRREEAFAALNEAIASNNEVCASVRARRLLEEFQSAEEGELGELAGVPSAAAAAVGFCLVAAVARAGDELQRTSVGQRWRRVSSSSRVRRCNCRIRHVNPEAQARGAWPRRGRCSSRRAQRPLRIHVAKRPARRPARLDEESTGDEALGTARRATFTAGYARAPARFSTDHQGCA